MTGEQLSTASATQRAGQEGAGGAETTLTPAPSCWGRCPCSCSTTRRCCSHELRASKLPNTQTPGTQHPKYKILRSSGSETCSLQAAGAPGGRTAEPRAPSSLPGGCSCCFSCPSCPELSGAEAAPVVQRWGTLLTQPEEPAKRRQRRKRRYKKGPCARDVTPTCEAGSAAESPPHAGSQPRFLTAFLSKKMFQISFPKPRESFAAACWHTSAHK